MKPLKIKKSDNLKKELSKIKGGDNTKIPPLDDGSTGNSGSSFIPGIPGNAGCNLDNNLLELEVKEE